MEFRWEGRIQIIFTQYSTICYMFSLPHTAECRYLQPMRTETRLEHLVCTALKSTLKHQYLSFKKKITIKKFSFHFKTKNKHHCLKQGFLTSALLTFWATSFLIVGDHLVHCRMVSNIPDRSAKCQKHFPLVVINKTVSKYCQMSLCGENHPQLRNHDTELAQGPALSGQEVLKGVKKGGMKKWIAPFVTK